MSPAAELRTVRIPDGQNSLIVHLQGHSWVSVSSDSRPPVRTSSADPAVAFTLAPGTYQVLTDGRIERVTTGAVAREPSMAERLRRGAPALLQLTCHATDRHVVDGTAEIAADGTSSCAITVQKTDPSGIPLTGGEHDDEIFVRMTGGRITDDTGQRCIRSLKLQSGRAMFRLISEVSPKVVTVSVLSRNTLVSAADVRVEFV